MTEAVAAVETPALPPAEVVAEATAPASETPAKEASVEQSTPSGETPEKAESTPDYKSEIDRQRRSRDKAYRKFAAEKARADLLQQQMAELQKTQPKQSDPDEPRIENFSDLEEWGKAKAEHAVKKASQKAEADRQSHAQRQYVEKLTSEWEDKVEKFADENPDFESLVGELKPVNTLTEAIMDEDNGPQVALHLAKNPQEAVKLRDLPPLKQAKEVAKLAAKLAAEPAKPKTPSKAPAPITPVGGVSGGANEMPQDSDPIDVWMKKTRALEAKTRTRSG